ncbi:hypothetical protein WN55_11590 [Dufourea novaeangliae]|uniref:Uncharacterized protein n=1 Tax=Dufourea novaeangliae TaxID=178035 RepID=A0A154PB18_DUFNO|nr:hypothetical protein WN55_11590 [Dufourea novaeangliae]
MPQAMPETAISPKSLSSLSTSTTPREVSSHFTVEKRLPRCVRRKFQTYSQLPVRCHRSSPYYRPRRPSLRLAGLTTINYTGSINTAKSCPDSLTCASMFRAIGLSSCKKSLSMIDLTESVMEAENGDLRSDSSSTLEKLEDNEKMYTGNEGVGFSVGIKNWMDGFVSAESAEGGTRFFQNPRKAASLVCRVLVLNAWRRRRDEVLYLRDTIDKLRENTKNLQLQISVLRRLIETENNRVGRLTSEVHHFKVLLDETAKDRDIQKREKEKIEEEVRRLHEVSEERLVTAENLQNELITARNQLQALDEQISRDREKLLKLREDKRMLLDKATCETLATERGARAEKAESAVEELQLKLATQMAMFETSQQQIQRYTKGLQSKEDEKVRLEKRFRTSEETGKSLNLRVAFLEAQLADREAALRRVESTCNSQVLELNELKERLIRQSQDGGWSSRMLQIAGSVVRAPGAILRSWLSTTGPVLTS